MPLIPIYKSQGNIQVGGTPKIDNPEMSLSAIEKSKRAQGELTNTIESAENLLTKVRDFRETTEADAFAFERVASVKAAANEDIGFDSSIYDVELEKIGNEASKTISGGLAKAEFMANYRKRAAITSWGIKNLFREREVEAANASIEYKKEQIKVIYPKMSSEEQMKSVADFKTTLMNGVKTGILTQSAANLKDLEFQKEVSEAVVNDHVITNPAAALIGLKEGKDGPYAGISEQFRTDSIEKAEAYDKKYKAEAEAERKKRVNSNEDEIIKRMIDPQKQPASEGELVDLMNKEDVSPEFAAAAIKNIRSAKKVKAETKNTVFNNFAKDIIKTQKTPEDIKTELLASNGAGELNNNDFNTLFTFNQAVTKEGLKSVTPKQKHLWGLMEWADESKLTAESMNRMFKDYMERINNNEEPALAVDSAMKKEVLILHPKAAGYPKEGKKVMDSNGVFKTILPTGEIKDAEIKKESNV